MTRKSRRPVPAVEPYPHLLRTRDICVLWMLRMIVHESRHKDFLTHPLYSTVRARLEVRLAQPSNDSDKALIHDRLEATLWQLKAREKGIGLPAILRTNLDMLCRHFSFNRVERSILALAVLLRIDDDLFKVANNGDKCVDTSEALGRVLGIPASAVAKAVEPSSRLRRSNLIRVMSGGDLADMLQLRRGGLRKLGKFKIGNVDEMLDGFVVTPPAPSLLPSDYAHLEPGLPLLQRFLFDALRHKRTGVNVLLYGAPGTGKTELVRLLASQVGVPLFEVAGLDSEGDSMLSGDRLAQAAISQFLLGRRNAILCFDEVESIFNDGSGLFGRPSTAESQKSAFNRMLECNGVPTFWIANSILGIDPAFVRRFDLVIHLEAPHRKQRLKLLERECGDMVSQEQLTRLASVRHITPAVVTRVASVVRRIAPRNSRDAEKLLETVLDGVLQAQRHPPLRLSLPDADAGGFDPALCNSGTDLSRLMDGLIGSGVGRICLYGPPGTGKTAFGKWVADRLDKPLLLKRVSDLQSPWLGQMEKNLAAAFDEARRDDAILQIDEVDSFLQDRRQAQRSWEVSQVNEFLTQLESFEGMLIASTNLMDNLDQAALRRFDYKIRMDYLRPEQANALLERSLSSLKLGPASEADRHRLVSRKLTPGDFAVVARRQRVVPFADPSAVVDVLCAEADVADRDSTRRIGFV